MSVILIIEDDEQVRVLASLLRDAGYDVLARQRRRAQALLNLDQSIDLLFVTSIWGRFGGGLE